MRLLPGTLSFLMSLWLTAMAFAEGPNPRVPTLGGKQFWSDHFVQGDWRIQQNVLTGHFRLLDHRDFRLVSGSYEECKRVFDQIRTRDKIAREASTSRKAVLVLHGLGRSRQSMDKLVHYLRANSDYRVLNVSYASTRIKIGDHAHTLGHLLRNLPELEEVNFVAHSMGNLVIRRYLHEVMQDKDRADELKRVRRIVMLAPPNQGATLADRFRKNAVFRTLWGTSGGEIADWDSLKENLAVPPMEFGILAGGTGTAEGRNPWIEGDDDFVVAVDETKLDGAHDFAVLPTIHGMIMDDPKIHEYTLRFLQRGYFISGAQRVPLLSASGTIR